MQAQPTPNLFKVSLSPSVPLEGSCGEADIKARVAFTDLAESSPCVLQKRHCQSMEQSPFQGRPFSLRQHGPAHRDLLRLPARCPVKQAVPPPLDRCAS